MQTASRADVQPMHIIYPTNGCVVSLPVQSDGTAAALNCSVAHTDPAAEVFWHLDNTYLGSTRDIHQMSVQLSNGVHRITVIDSCGYEQAVSIIVV